MYNILIYWQGQLVCDALFELEVITRVGGVLEIAPNPVGYQARYQNYDHEYPKKIKYLILIYIIMVSNTRLLYINNGFQKKITRTKYPPQTAGFAGSFMKPGGSLKLLKYPKLTIL
jgi:hypothetical protein